MINGDGAPPLTTINEAAPHPPSPVATTTSRTVAAAPSTAAAAFSTVGTKAPPAEANLETGNITYGPLPSPVTVRRSRVCPAVEEPYNQTCQPAMKANSTGEATAFVVETDSVSSRSDSALCNEPSAIGSSGGRKTAALVLPADASAARARGFARSRRPSAPAQLSSSALVNRSNPLVSKLSPVSPAPPCFSSDTGFSTAVPVVQLYRVPAAFYGGGFIPLSSAPPSLPICDVSNARCDCLGSAAPSLYRATAATSAGEGNIDGRSNGFELQSGVCAQEQGSAGPPYASIEERVRRAAQAFESDVQSAFATSLMLLQCSSDNNSFHSEAGVQVSRGYRCLASPSSYDSVEKLVYEGVGRIPTTGARDDSGSAEISDVVALLRTGPKRRRSIAAHLINNADTVGNSMCYMNSSRAGEVLSSRLLLTSPSASSLSYFLSPQSPTIPRNTTPSTTVVQPGSKRHSDGNTAVATTDATTTTSASAGGSGSATPASPFHSLLEVFSEEHAGQLTAKPTSETSSYKEATRTKVSGRIAEVVMTQPWLRLWASRSMSRQLAAQLTHDADILKVRHATAHPLNDNNGGARSTRTAVGAAATVFDEDNCRGDPPDVNERTAAAFASTSRLSVQPASAVAAGASRYASPQTLYEALLQLFDLLEQLERTIVNLFTSVEFVQQKKTGAAVSVQHITDLHEASTTCFPVNPQPNVRDIFTPVFRQWHDVLLLRWPGGLASFGYLEWWLRHDVWEKLITAATTEESGIGIGVAAEDVAKSTTATTSEERFGTQGKGKTSQAGLRVRDAELQQRQDFHLLRETLVATSGEGMRRLFDFVVDAFILSVQDLLRCCCSSGGEYNGTTAAATAIYQHRARETNNRINGLQVHESRFKRTSGAWAAWHANAVTRCSSLLRVLTSLYADPPRVLRPVLGETSTQTPFPLFASSTVVRENLSKSNSTDVDGTAPLKTEGKNKESSGKSPASPGNPTATCTHTSFVSGSFQQQRQSDERTCARQLHYQLLYAVCRLCSELPLSWGSTTALAAALPASVDAEARTVKDTWTTGVMRFPSLSGSSSSVASSYYQGAVDHGELFAAAVRLAAIIAMPLSNVQLPMKGDLLCVMSRLARQRVVLLRRGWLNEREYGLCMGHLGALLAQAT